MSLSIGSSRWPSARPFPLAHTLLIATGASFLIAGVCPARTRVIKINATTSSDFVHTASILVAEESACTVNADCDDDNECTDDICSDGVCLNLNNSDPCNDGLFCTLIDVCTGGTCVGSGDTCQGFGCDEDFDQCGPFSARTDPHPPGPVPSTGTVSTDATCDTIAVAVVVDNGQTINILSVSPGDVKMAAVDPAHQALLQSALEAEGLFDDATQDLFFVQYNPPQDSCTNFKVTVEFTVKGTAPGSDPKAVSHLVAAGTNVKDLENARINNEELNNFQFVEFPIIGPGGIPAASTWGVLAMALALLVGARIRFGKRSRLTP